MKKGLILIGLICISIPIMSSETLVGVLMSKDTDSVMIDGRTFEGDGITSLVIAPKFSNSKFGGYLSVGGTFGRSEDERQSDEENKDFKNNMSYRVVNLGVTYSPISNVTFLGGAGYGQSEGKYYHNIRYDNRNRVKFDTSHTEKDRGINYNAGLNFSYKNWGIITMYDSYPKVFSVGISYNYKPVKPRPKQRIQQKKSSGIGMGTVLGIGAALLLYNGVKQGMKNVKEHEKKVNALSREDYRKYNACIIRADGNDAYRRSCDARWIY
jgi:hypothetical protein